MWDSNSQPRDQEPHVLPTEPARHQSHALERELEVLRVSAIAQDDSQICPHL